MKLDRNLAVTEALALLDEVGLDDLSTRKLAQRLGVQQPALYWHFRDKQALLDAMNAEMLRRARPHRAPVPGQDWRAFLDTYATGFRQALLSVRDGARVHAGSHAEAEDLPAAEAQLAHLVRQGMSLALALAVLVAVARYVVGFTLEEQAEQAHPPEFGGIDAAAFPMLSQAAQWYAQADPDAMFRTGLDLLLDGVGMQIRNAP